MREQGRSKGFTVGVWTATAVLLAAAVVVGNAALSATGEEPLAVLLSFAGGAVSISLGSSPKTATPPPLSEW
jgi:hypothetical protein